MQIQLSINSKHGTSTTRHKMTKKQAVEITEKLSNDKYINWIVCSQIINKNTSKTLFVS